MEDVSSTVWHGGEVAGRETDARMRVQDVEAIRSKLQIAVESKDGVVYRPITKFEHAGFSPSIMESCKCVRRCCCVRQALSRCSAL